MIKTRIIVSMISAIALFTVVTPLAYAGGGMGTGAGLTTCRLILNGAPNQGQTVRLTGEFVSSLVPDLVKVGAAVLVCDLLVEGTRIAGPFTGQPIAATNDTRTTCYAVTGADSARIGITMQDLFTEAPLSDTGTRAVQIGAIQLLCVPSVITPQQ